MKKILIIITYLVVLILGAVLGFFYSVYKFGSATEVVSMDIGDALPLKAEQISSGLKGYFNLWKGRLELAAVVEEPKTELVRKLYNLDPGNIQQVIIVQHDSAWVYPDSEFNSRFTSLSGEIDYSSTDFGLNIFFNPLELVFHSDQLYIEIKLSDQILKRRIAFQGLASSATPFWVVLYQQDVLVFASEPDYQLPLDSIFQKEDVYTSQTDTGSVWLDTLPWIYWKRFNMENKQYWMVISYKHQQDNSP
ncbi:MAG: hypothetical protein ACP5FK_09810 [bacterium]